MHGGNDKGKPAKRKQTTLKTRKSLGEPRDDSEDDFKPTKAKAKKAAAPTLKEKPVATTSKEKLPAVRPKYEESDEEAEIIPAPKSKPARVDPPLIEIDSEEDKLKVKAAPKRKRYALLIVHCHDLLSISIAIASS